MIDLGSIYQVAADVRDAAGALTNPSSATLTITLPDGTTVTPTVTLPPAETGKLRVDYVTVQAGRHVWRLTTTVPTTAYTDVFDVRPAESRNLFSLADGKKHLNIGADSTGEDDEIRDWIGATTRVVEHFVGPVARRTVVERHNFRAAGVRVLRQTPALSLTSVVPVLTGGTSYDPDDLDLDPETGLVQRKDGGLLYGPLLFTYAAGRSVVTENISGAGRIILQHLWRTQRGTGRGPVFGGGEDYAVTEPIPGLGYAVPNRALQLLEDDRLPPGVA